MGGLLDDIEEGVLHDDLGGLDELFVEQEVLVVRVILLVLGLELMRELG